MRSFCKDRWLENVIFSQLTPLIAAQDSVCLQNEHWQKSACNPQPPGVKGAFVVLGISIPPLSLRVRHPPFGRGKAKQAARYAFLLDCRWGIS